MSDHLEKIQYSINTSNLTIHYKKSSKLVFNIYKNKELIYENVKTIESIPVEVGDYIECYFIKQKLEFPYVKVLVESDKNYNINLLDKVYQFFNILEKAKNNEQELKNNA